MEGCCIIFHSFSAVCVKVGYIPSLLFNLPFSYSMRFDASNHTIHTSQLLVSSRNDFRTRCGSKRSGEDLVWRVLSVSSWEISWSAIILSIQKSASIAWRTPTPIPTPLLPPVESVGQPRYYITKTSHELNHSVILAKLIILHAVLTCHPHFSHEILSLYDIVAWWRCWAAFTTTT